MIRRLIFNIRKSYSNSFNTRYKSAITILKIRFIEGIPWADFEEDIQEIASEFCIPPYYVYKDLNNIM